MRADGGELAVCVLATREACDPATDEDRGAADGGAVHWCHPRVRLWALWGDPCAVGLTCVQKTGNSPNDYTCE